LSELFREKAGILLILDAVLLPIILLSEDIFTSGAFMLAFIIVQVFQIILFARQETAGMHEWWLFLATLTGSLIMFMALALGRSMSLEIIGFFLFLAYIVSAVYFFAGEKFSARFSMRKSKDESASGLTQEELEAFRKKDEMGGLLEEFKIPAPPKQKHLTEYDDFTKPAKTEEEIEWVDSPSKESNDYYEIKAAPEDEAYSNEGYLELYPEEIQREIEDLRKEPGVEIVELKETPKLDVARIREGSKKIEEGVQTIKEKVKLIAEKAILEGAEKKLKKMIAEEKKAATTTVYASVTGNKYHINRGCISLKRVSKKDIVSYATTSDARKKGLKPCGLCKK
jgi:hypothetical protein